MGFFNSDVTKRLLKKARKQAGLPPVPKDLPVEHQAFFGSLRENLAVRMGQEGDPLEKAITFRDLGKARMLKYGGGVGGIPSVLPPSPEDIFDYGPPPALTGFTANGGFDIIFLTWDNPLLGYNYYVEVWRSPFDALDPNGPDMKLIGSSSSVMYVDNLNGDLTVYYYWVRVVKAIGSRLIYGPFNQTAGTPGQITLDPAYVIESLQGQLSESELAAALSSRIDLIDAPTTGLVDRVGVAERDIETMLGYCTVGGVVDDQYTDPAACAAAGGDWTASESLAQSVKQVYVTDGSQTAALEQMFQAHGSDLDGLKLQYTLKLDNNGYVSGLGLYNDGTTSEFIVASDAVYFIDPAQSLTTFNPAANYASVDAVRNTQLVFGYAEVNGVKRFVINVPAYIPDASITTAQISNATINQAQIVDLSVSGADIDIATIWELATIGGDIRSQPYTAGSVGWRVTKGGFAEFSNVTVRGHVEMDTGYIAESVQIGGLGRLAYQDVVGEFLPDHNFELSAAEGMGIYWKAEPDISIASTTSGPVLRIRPTVAGALRESAALPGSGGLFTFPVAAGDSIVLGFKAQYFGMPFSYSQTSGTPRHMGAHLEFYDAAGLRISGGDQSVVFEIASPEISYSVKEYSGIVVVPNGAFSASFWLESSNLDVDFFSAWVDTQKSVVLSNLLAQAADGQITDWKKPGTTFIAGSSIFADDIYVDTVNIQGQAVTFPLGTSGGAFSVPASAGSTTVLSMYIASTGAPIIVTACVAARWGGNAGTLELWRDSTMHGGSVTRIGDGVGGFTYTGSVDISEGANYDEYDGSVTAVWYLGSSAPGTYQVRFLRSIDQYSGCTVVSRTMAYLEAKR